MWKIGPGRTPVYAHKELAAEKRAKGMEMLKKSTTPIIGNTWESSGQGVLRSRCRPATGCRSTTT
jgi:hypothetical protein